MKCSGCAVIGAALALAAGSAIGAFAAGEAGGGPKATTPRGLPSLEQLLDRQPVMNGPLSIDQAVATALRESPVVRGAAEEVEAALRRVQAARAQTRPQLSTTTFASGGSESMIYATTDPVRPTNLFAVPRGAFLDQDAMFMLPLYTGGRLRALVRQAAAAHGAAGADLEGVRQEVALMTRTAYQDALARRALIDVARATTAASQEQLRVDQSRFQAGAIPEFYLRRDEAELANAQQQMTDAQRDYDLALVQLKTVMGVHPDSRLEPAGTLGFEPAAAVIERMLGAANPTSPPAPPLRGEGGLSSPSALGIAAPPSLAGKGAGGLGPALTPTLTPTPVPSSETPTSPPASLADRYGPGLRMLAARQRPELLAARLRVEQAAQGVTVARSAYWPQIGIAVTDDFMTGDHAATFGGTSFGLTAALPLFDAGLRRANRRTAEADHRRSEQDYEKTVLDVAQQVANALLALGAAEQNVGTAQAGTRSAEEDYRVALQRYQAGRGILVEVLDALAARTRAETNVVQALFDYNVAQDQLRRAVGQPEPPPPSPPAGR